MRNMTYLCAGLAGCMLLVAGGCGDADKPATSESAQPAAPAAQAAAADASDKPDEPPPKPVRGGEPRPAILLAQAQFIETTDERTGKTRSKPGAARLVILRQTGDQWQREILEDPDSNVFHKALFFDDPSVTDTAAAILTIGANGAAVKLWRPTDDGWAGEALWNPTFGGKQNRLRDFELGDVTGDGQPDIAIGTHDQGVIAVLSRSDDGWQATEIDRKPKIWVHEIELGDLDGDGTPEIYATPSNPNRFDEEQPGKIVAYRRTPEGFQQRVVEEFTVRHVKEILVADLEDGSGRPVLLASVEGETGNRPDAPPNAKQTLIRLYHLEGDKYAGKDVCSLPGGLCRLLNVGDVDGDGKPELIASTYKSGIWLARPGTDQWKTELIDADSGSFEHATALADLDGDGVQEIYVAADNQHEVRRYRWADGDWKRETLSKIEDDKLTFGISVGEL